MISVADDALLLPDHHTQQVTFVPANRWVDIEEEVTYQPAYHSWVRFVKQ